MLAILKSLLIKLIGGAAVGLGVELSQEDHDAIVSAVSLVAGGLSTIVFIAVDYLVRRWTKEEK